MPAEQAAPFLDVIDEGLDEIHEFFTDGFADVLGDQAMPEKHPAESRLNKANELVVRTYERQAGDQRRASRSVGDPTDFYNQIGGELCREELVVIVETIAQRMRKDAGKDEVPRIDTKKPIASLRRARPVNENIENDGWPKTLLYFIVFG